MCSQNNLRLSVIMWLASVLLISTAYIWGHFKLMTEFFVFLFAGISLLLITFLRIFHLAIREKLDNIISLLERLNDK